MLVKADPIEESFWQRLKTFCSVALVFVFLFAAAGFLIAWGWIFPAYLMWQGGWWAMLGLGLWIFNTFAGKLIGKILHD